MTNGVAPVRALAAPRRWRFGNAEFDAGRFELRVAGAPIEIQHKPLQLLSVLLERAGQLVPRDELYDLVWGDRVTVDHVLANAVSKLRAALGETLGTCIVTVPRQGYRLDGPVHWQPAVAAVAAAAAASWHPAPGASLPGRPEVRLERRLDNVGGGNGQVQTWRAHVDGAKAPRVFKIAPTPTERAALHREHAVLRLLRELFGQRPDFVEMLDWNLETAPFWLELSWGGQSLLEWAKSGDDGQSRLAKLPRPARLRLFIQIADAVAAAHSLGVLHRDLKPANLLVEPMADSEGLHVRLADFGSARLLDPERLERLRITRLGGTLAQQADGAGSTPLYMAPELGSGAPPSVAADVYALGVILFQLLVADLTRTPMPGWQREIDDELLREDIALATDGDPAHRISSVAELLRRVAALSERHVVRQAELAAAAVAAADRQELARQRARRPWAVVALALSGGVALGACFWAFAERGQRQALAAEVLAGSHRLSLPGDLLKSARQSGRTVFGSMQVADALQQAAAEIDERHATDSPAARAAMHLYAQSLLSQIDRPEAALASARRAAPLIEGKSSTQRQQRRESRLLQARDLLQLGRATEAAAVLAAESNDSVWAADRATQAETRLLTAQVAAATGRSDAQEHLESAWQAAQWADGTNQRDRAGLALAACSHGRPADAAALLKTLLDDQRQRLGEVDSDLGLTQVAMSESLLMLGRDQQAWAALREGAARLFGANGGARSAWMRELRNELAHLELGLGDAASALAQWRQLEPWLIEHHGANSSDVALNRAHQALALSRGGDAAEAEALMRRALDALAPLLDLDAPQHQYQRLLLAQALLSQGGDDTPKAGAARRLLQGVTIEALTQVNPRVDWPAELARLQRGAGLQPTPKAPAG